jgi:tetratricopeptide (TPR) repeat protein
MRFTTCDQFLAIVSESSRLLKRDQLPAAEHLLAGAVKMAPMLPNEYAQNYYPLALAYLIRLRQRQERPDEADKFRKVLATLLDSDLPAIEPELFHLMMANILEELSEFHRAIPLCEQAIAFLATQNEPLDVAAMLHTMGRCYTRWGLRDHAIIPLRAAVAIYRDIPEDPRLPSALLSLGLALILSAPGEAESLLREVADIHMAKAHVESATTAWVNLGFLCSKHNRDPEAQVWYEKALRVREMSPGTKPAGIAILMNNLAGCHRRMGNFAEAHHCADKAIELRESIDDDRLASAYGTRGEIFHDEGLHQEALLWLQRSREVREKSPSPNLASLAEILEYEIRSLRQLGRNDEAAAAESRLANARAVSQQKPQASFDLTALSATQDGAVLVELPQGIRNSAFYRGPDLRELASRLREVVDTEHAGMYTGNIGIPESTTLFFCGPDAEALYRVLEPALAAEAWCAGAHITIRQGRDVREVYLPGKVM